MQKTIFVALLLMPIFSYSQKIDHMASFRDIESNSYFRINYDNDYFSSSDKNYTQGYNLELVAPWIQANPVNHLFFTRGNKAKYGLSLEHIGFTPRNIRSAEIQFGDRPFAAAIMLKSFKIDTDTIRKTRTISTLSLGMIGPVAFGKEMQVAIHKAIDGVIPMGWRNQIENDVILNYSLGFEKQLIRYKDIFSLQTNSTLQFGTLFTQAALGFNTTFGIINSSFSSAEEKQKFRIYIYLQPLAKVVAYDATLQGGLFRSENPYTISTDAIERFTAQFNYGLVIQTRGLYFEYARTNLTKEFASGSAAKWGGLKVGLKL